MALVFQILLYLVKILKYFKDAVMLLLKKHMKLPLKNKLKRIIIK